MRLLWFCLVFMIAGIVTAQELPEPTTADIQYKAQIRWGSLVSNSAWIDLPIVYNVVNGTVTNTHRYGSKLGEQVFEADAIGSESLAPKKVIVTFSIDSLPTTQMISFYRIRIAGYIGDVEGMPSGLGEWSDPSYWVVIYNVVKAVMPVR
jgi:hypothetical protein